MNTTSDKRPHPGTVTVHEHTQNIIRHLQSLEENERIVREGNEREQARYEADRHRRATARGTG